MMLKMSKLSVGYSNAILTGIDLTVEGGEILGIIGPNGSGKSTLLKTISAILKPMDGVVYVDGRNVHKLKPLELAKKLAVTTTDRSDVGFLKGFDVVSLGRYPYTDAFGRLSERDAEIVMEALRLVNAEHLADKPFSEMSDGEKQKIMIARALAQQPKVLLLDEPTSFLDAKHRVEIPLILRRIANEKRIAIVLTTHDIELAVRVCDRIAMVKNGRIIAEGWAEDLDSKIVEELYDISVAKFDPFLGTFELKGEGRARIHIVCGGGSGARVMRLLTKNRIPFSVGVIHEDDIDFYVAKHCAVEVVKERPYEDIRDKTLEDALRIVENCDFVIDTGFPIGKINAKNLELLRTAKRVYSLRNKEELEEIGLDAETIKITDLLKICEY